MSVPLPVAPSDAPAGYAPPPPAMTAATAAAAAALVVVDDPADDVRETFAAFRERLDAGDFAGAMGYYADDPRFVWVEDGVVRYRARADVARGFEHLRLLGAVRFAYGEPAVTLVARDVATLAVTFETSVGDPAHGHAFAGAMTVTMVRMPAGWRFLAGHSSTRRPRPTRK